MAFCEPLNSTLTIFPRMCRASPVESTRLPVTSRDLLANCCMRSHHRIADTVRTRNVEFLTSSASTSPDSPTNRWKGWPEERSGASSQLKYCQVYELLGRAQTSGLSKTRSRHRSRCARPFYIAAWRRAVKAASIACHALRHAGSLSTGEQQPCGPCRRCCRGRRSLPRHLTAVTWCHCVQYP